MKRTLHAPEQAMRNRLAPFALSIVGLLVFTSAADAQTAPRLVDLSESGAALAFTTLPVLDPALPPTTEVRVAAAFAWDRLDFEVRGATRGERLRFVVRDAPPDLQPRTSTGFVDGVFAWRAATPVLSAFRGELTFDVVVPRERFLVRLGDMPRGAGRALYYTWDRFVTYMGDIQNEPLAQVTQIGTSVQGRPLWCIVVDVPSTTPKKTVLMGVRQHGDEFGSSYLLEGALDLLLGRGGLTPAPELLEKVRWVIYPLMNPDGAFADVRYNANGVDLNRDWDRNGASAVTQEPETFALQSDVEAREALYGFDIGGDHHGWPLSPDGGFRYAEGQSVSFVSTPEYEEATKDTEVITLHDPSQSNWMENGGSTGMLRSEMFLRFGFLLHTAEYDGTASTEAQFRTKGQAWLDAVLDTLFAPAFTDAVGAPRPFVVSPLDTVYVTVDDLDENQTGGVELVSVVVRDPATGDQETLTLTETGNSTGVFRNTTALLVFAGPALPGNGILETQPGSEVLATYTDDDFPRDSSTARLIVLPGRFNPSDRVRRPPR